MRHAISRALLVPTLVGTLAATWELLAACSSSDSTTAPLTPDGSTGDDAAGPPADAGAPDVLPDTIGKACDPVAQDCTDPNLRCTVILESGDYFPACEPPYGIPDKQEGQACSRTGPGHDNCVKGLHCLPEGVIATACGKLCEKDSDCPPGAQCGTITTLLPPVGVCWKTCTPFGSECGSGTCSSGHYDSDGVTEFEACREIGGGTVGTSCSAQWDCVADTNCYGRSGFTCTPMCDSTHACDGGTCMKIAGIAGDGGLCQ
jgi:hypothetical protein